MTKCTRCNGHKTIIGMGHMKEKCPECKGLGLLVKLTLNAEEKTTTKNKTNAKDKKG